MSYVTYRLIHFIGVFITLTLVAGVAGLGLASSGSDMKRLRKGIAAGHIVAMLLVATGGFGMMARLGDFTGGLPAWITVKLVIWLSLTALIALPFLGRSYARATLVALPFIALLAAATALFKPF